jgi:hypothetical protein
VVDLLRQRLEALGIFRLAADRHGEQRAAVERRQAGHDARLVLAELGVGVLARQLQGSFIGFGAGIAEEGAVGEGCLGQRHGQAQDRLVGVAVAEVPQGIDLPGERVDQGRMGVAQAGDGDAGGEIEVMFTGLVPQVQAGSAHRHHLGGGVGWDQHFVESLACDRPRCDTRIKLSVHGIPHPMLGARPGSDSWAVASL